MASKDLILAASSLGVEVRQLHRPAGDRLGPVAAAGPALLEAQGAHAGAQEVQHATEQHRICSHTARRYGKHIISAMERAQAGVKD